jgi:hypothetical protein
MEEGNGVRLTGRCKSKAKTRIFLIGIVIYFIMSCGGSGEGPCPFRPGSEPDGFRGLKWGQEIDASFIEAKNTDSESKWCVRKLDILAIGEVQLQEIKYLFFKNKFYGVWIVVSGQRNIELFRDICLRKYGDCKNYPYKWRGKEFQAHLIYNESLKMAYLTIEKINISKQVLDYEKKRQQDSWLKQEEDKKQKTEKAIKEGF